MKPKQKSTMFILSLALILYVSCMVNPVFATSSISSNTPVLENPVTPDHRGSFLLKNDVLLDLIIPETINGVTASAIGVKAFHGCDLLRTVTIPLTIRSIGAGAFADCSNLKFIILDGRVDTSDMYLGEGWSGDAELIFIAPDSLVPSASLKHFEQTLASVQMIKTVDAFSLEQSKEMALSLREAYESLLPEECTNLLYAEYQEALTTLLCTIQSAEEALSKITVVPEPVSPDSGSDPALSDPTGNEVPELSDAQQNTPTTGQLPQPEPTEPIVEPEQLPLAPALEPSVSFPSDGSQSSASPDASDIQVTDIAPIA